MHAELVRRRVEENAYGVLCPASPPGERGAIRGERSFEASLYVVPELSKRFLESVGDVRAVSYLLRSFSTRLDCPPSAINLSSQRLHGTTALALIEKEIAESRFVFPHISKRGEQLVDCLNSTLTSFRFRVGGLDCRAKPADQKRRPVLAGRRKSDLERSLNVRACFFRGVGSETAVYARAFLGKGSAFVRSGIRGLDRSSCSDRQQPV